MSAAMNQPKYISEKETRERMVDRLRSHGFEKKLAEKTADSSVGRVVDTLTRKAGMSEAERNRKPNDPR